MRTRTKLVVALMTWASVAHAGVVMTQQTTTPGADGKEKNQTYTTTIDGNRLKTVTPDLTTIMDIDKDKILLIRPAAKTYSEMPLSKFGPFMARGLTGEFKPTGKKKTIAGYSCEEYQHDFKAYGDVSSVTCVSKDAPGAAEASMFYRTMAEKVAEKGKSARPEGVVLSEESTVKPIMPEIAGVPPETLKKMKEEQAKRPPIVTKVVVTSIKADKVPADVWEIPKDYKNEATPYSKLPGAGGPPPAKQGVPPSPK